MEWFEKEYKKRFENEATMEGVESGPLWEQISKSIPQAETSKKPKYWKWTLFLAIAIGLLLSLLLMQDNNIEKENQLEQNAKCRTNPR